MAWKSHLAGRLALAVGTILLGGLVSATLARYAPGFGVDERLLDPGLKRESVQAIRGDVSAEEKVVSYYGAALWRMARGDLGTSRTLQRPVRELLTERSADTVRLLAAGLGLSWTAAFAVLLAGWFADCPTVNTVNEVASGALLCIPVGAVALLLVLANGPPYVAVAVVVFPKIYRFLEGLLLVERRMPHITAARAHGANSVRLLIWHVLPGVRAEMLALFGVSVTMAVGVSIPVEALCGKPGLGQLAWQAALGRDLPVLVCISMVVTACTVLANSGADLLSDACGVRA